MQYTGVFIHPLVVGSLTISHSASIFLKSVVKVCLPAYKIIKFSFIVTQSGGQHRGSILRFGGQIKRQFRGPRTSRELFYLQ